MQTARKSTRGRAPLVGGAYVFRNQQEETRESAHRSVQLTNRTDQEQPASTTDQLQTTQTEGEEIDLNFDPNNKLKMEIRKINLQRHGILENKLYMIWIQQNQST